MSAGSWALLSIAFALGAVLASLRARRYAGEAAAHAADATRHAARAIGMLRTADADAIERQTRALRDLVPDVRRLAAKR